MRKSMPLFAVLAIAFALMTQVASAQVGFIYWVSGTGSDANESGGCVRTAPCLTFEAALRAAQANTGGTISCADPVDAGQGLGQSGILTITFSVTIDCAADFGNVVVRVGGPAFVISNATDSQVTLRGMTIRGLADTGAGGQPATAGLEIDQPAFVRIENCKIYDVGGGPAILVKPGIGTTTVKIQDSTFSNNAGGITVAPTAAARVSLSIDRSRIESNSGGGIRIDSSNASGSITTHVTDSSISFNTSAGINVVSGSAGGQNVVNLSGDVLASNGGTGLQANGANAAALVKQTSLSNNATALSAINSGRILTYGNNSIVGSVGTGFSASASLQ